MQEITLYKTNLLEIGFFKISPQETCFSDEGFVDSPIIVFPKNSIWIQYAGSTPFVADPTIVNFYNKGQTYRRFKIDQSGDYCHWFKISDEILSEIVCKEKQHFLYENITCPAKVFLEHLKVLQLIADKNMDNRLVIEELVLNIFQELLVKNQQSDRLFDKSQEKHKRLIEQVKETLQSDLSQKISLQALAKKHHTSPYHLSRVFKTINGLGVNHYRTQQRLRALALDLKLQQSDLMNLALDYGFSSHSHMSASFKKSFGLTPNDFQNIINIK